MKKTYLAVSALLTALSSIVIAPIAYADNDESTDIQAGSMDSTGSVGSTGNVGSTGSTGNTGSTGSIDNSGSMDNNSDSGS